MIKNLTHWTVLQEVNYLYLSKNKHKDLFIRNFKNYNNRHYLDLYQQIKLMLEGNNH